MSDERLQRGSRRGGGEGGGREARSEQLNPEPVRRHHRTGSSRHGSSIGKTVSAVCVMAAFLAVMIAVIMELIAHTRQEPSNSVFNLLTGLVALIAIGAGLYAQILQFHHWSLHVRRRLQVGLTVSVLTLVLVIANFHEKCVASAGGNPGIAAEQKSGTRQVVPEDDSLFKSGWYGELQFDGVMAVISSFPENASESRQFNRRVAKPVSYATLSVINLGKAEPVFMQKAQVGLLLDSGEEVQSLAVKSLLRVAVGNESLFARLTEPLTLAVGAMAPDIPICQEPDFSWEHVRGVRIMFNSKTVTIPGRMMTAAEKRALADTVAPKANTSNTNLSAEAWFKDL